MEDNFKISIKFTGGENMNLLEIDIDKIKPYIIDAYVHVFGEEYKEIIEKNVNIVQFLQYPNVDGIEEYYKYVKKKLMDEYEKDCKRELNPEEVHFLYSADISNIIKKEGKFFENFKEKISEFSKYEEYLKDNEKKIKELEKETSKKFFEKVEKNLPRSLKQRLKKEQVDVKSMIEIIFFSGLGAKSCIEYFSSEDEKKLKNKNVPEDEKNRIYLERTCYLELIGIKREQNLTYEELYKSYCKNRKIRKLIPYKWKANFISKERKKAFDIFTTKCIFSNKKFWEKVYTLYPKYEEEIYRMLKQGSVCVTWLYREKEFKPIIFYTVRYGECGMQDFILLHEMCHNIESGEIIKDGKRDGYRCGFETFSKDASYDERECNIYNPRYRRMERFNEAITDMFALEALQYLKQNDIHMLEQEWLEKKDINNVNTRKMVKDAIKPFFDKYRKYIIDARISGDMNKLYEVVGAENFLILNDIINKIDAMPYTSEMLKNGQKSEEEIKEYNKQIERIRKVYENMEKYEKNHTKIGKNQDCMNDNKYEDFIQTLKNALFLMEDNTNINTTSNTQLKENDVKDDSKMEKGGRT